MRDREGRVKNKAHLMYDTSWRKVRNQEGGKMEYFFAMEKKTR